MFYFLCVFLPFKLYFHKFYICLLFLNNYISKVNLVVVYSFLESYPWFFRYCPWFLLKPREPGATFKNKLPLVPARLFQGLVMIKSDVINDTFMQVDLTGDCYCLFLEFWKIAPGPSKIAPGSSKILWTRSNFYNILAPGSSDLISRLEKQCILIHAPGLC